MFTYIIAVGLFAVARGQVTTKPAGPQSVLSMPSNRATIQLGPNGDVQLMRTGEKELTIDASVDVKGSLMIQGVSLQDIIAKAIATEYPAVTKPPVTKPVTKPTATKPTAAKPTATKPATKPATTKPTTATSTSTTSTSTSTSTFTSTSTSTSTSTTAKPTTYAAPTATTNPDLNFITTEKITISACGVMICGAALTQGEVKLSGLADGTEIRYEFKTYTDTSGKEGYQNTGFWIRDQNTQLEYTRGSLSGSISAPATGNVDLIVGPYTADGAWCLSTTCTASTN